jgi:DNA-binding LytR/AlgR family response regulator
MLTIAICDENIDICKKLENMIVSVLFEECDCAVNLFTNLGDLLNSLLGNNKYDFLFIPVVCGDDSGLKLASIVREQRLQSEIVFTATNMKNVLDGYIYRAFDFYVFPISASRVKDMFNRYFLYNDRSGNFFYIKNGNQINKYDKFSIYYFASDGRKITMFTSGNPLSFYSKMNLVEEQVGVGVNNFVRVHQSYLVNVQYIKILTRDNIVMDNGEYIPVSRKYQENVHKTFLAYLERRI